MKTAEDPDLHVVSDRETLIALHESTSGLGWVRDDFWLSDRPLAEWHGIQTDQADRVTIIDLRDNALLGTLPYELGQLPHLSRLDLSFNALKGAIPASVDELTQIEVIDLGDNDLSGEIPVAIYDLPDLKSLCLCNNVELEGQVPPRLAAHGCNDPPAWGAHTLARSLSCIHLARRSDASASSINTKQPCQRNQSGPPIRFGSSRPRWQPPSPLSDPTMDPTPNVCHSIPQKPRASDHRPSSQSNTRPCRSVPTTVTTQASGAPATGPIEHA